MQNNNFFAEFILLIGAILGSGKANLNDVHLSWFTRIFNTIIGIFLGIVIANEYGTGLSIWLTALLALMGGMVGGTVLDVIQELAPTTIKSILKKKLGIKNE